MEQEKSKEEHIKEQIELGKAHIKGFVKPHPTVFSFTVEAHRDHYNATGNPLFLMHAFIDAYNNDYSVPKWVMEKLNEAFGAYVYGNHKFSFDDLSFSGKAA